MPQSDNVTPFRRPPRRPPPRRQGSSGLATHRGRAVLAQALTLLSFLVSFSAIYLLIFLGVSATLAQIASLVGLALGLGAAFIAAGNRMGSMPWASTHHEHVIRTIVIGASIWTLASLLQYFGPLVIATPFIQIIVTIWAVVRSGVGLALAVMRKPVWRPKGLLF